VKVDIAQDTDATLLDSGDPVVVVADYEVEVLIEQQQGPPGPASSVPGPVGPPGPQGPAGTPGLPGNQIYYGTTNPTPEIGINGDSYINKTSNFLFGPKAGGSWPAGVSLVGPQGAQGIQGIQGPQGIQGIPGNTVLYGSTDPVAGTGVNGNFYINTSTNFLFGPKTSGAWPAGTSLVGPTGVRGSKFFIGSGPPGAISGQINGDNYLDGSNGDTYTLTAGAWGSPNGNIRGPQGPQGIQGIQGIQGVPGTNGNTILYGTTNPVAGTGNNGDFYINTSTSFIYGPKAAGAWPAGTSLVGPQGAIGPQGPQGIPGLTTITVSDTPPPSPSDNMIWWESDTGMLWVRYNDGDSAQWVQAMPLPDINNAVRYDTAQAPTPTQQAQARANINTAPPEVMDLYGFYGMQVNGSAQIDQPAIGTANIGAGFGYLTDAWQAAATVTGGTFTAINLATPVAVAFPLAFERSVRLTASVKPTSVAAADYAMIGMVIEGYRLARCGLGRANGQPITVAFWAYADKAGTASLAMRNVANTRAFIRNFTLAATTPTYVVLTFPPCPDGVWNLTNLGSVRLDFCFACGSNLQTPADVWTTTSAAKIGSAANTNFFLAAADSVHLSGVTVFAGNNAPNAEQSPRALRQRSDELLLCQRYLYVVPPTNMFGHGQVRGGGTSAYMTIPLPTPLRASPTLSMPGNTTIYSGDSNSAVSAWTVAGFTADNSLLFTQTTHNANIGVSGAFCQMYEPTNQMPFDARM
jgi:hypothetical protein